MMDDTVDTVEKHYAQFVLAAREAAQVKMESGIGIEAHAELVKQRDQKVISRPAR